MLRKYKRVLFGTHLLLATTQVIFG